MGLGNSSQYGGGIAPQCLVGGHSVTGIEYNQHLGLEGLVSFPGV